MELKHWLRAWIEGVPAPLIEGDGSRPCSDVFMRGKYENKQ
jgi:hypothetical protein